MPNPAYEVKYIAENPESAFGLLEKFSSSRAGIDLFSDQLIDGVKNGKINPLKVRVWGKTLETILDRVNKETAENQFNEAAKYAETKFEFSGAEITKADVRTEYDYGACNDPVWRQLVGVLDAAKDQLKEREAFLKAIKEPITLLDEGSGEVVTISPPVIKRTAGLKVSIK